MTDQITPREFHEAEGVDDWRVLFVGAYAHFNSESFAEGLALVNAIGALAEAADHHPDVDLRYKGVTVHLVSHDVGSLSRRDVRLAQQISAAARDLGIAADPAGVQDLQFTIDVGGPAVRPFWQAVLGYRDGGEEDLVDPHSRGPSIRFQPTNEPRTERNRVHVDLAVPHDQAEARITAAVAAGGRVVSDRFAPGWWTLADPEGTEVDIATWQNRD
jgi:4a-hydroxytetrahydrobiopterin dehydratase